MVRHMALVSAAALVLLAAVALASPLSDLTAIFDYNPVAREGAIVVSGNARFTVLTNNVIRIEWSDASGQFEDRATQMAVNRRTAAVPSFTNTSSNGWLTIKTSRLTLSYQEGQSFNANTLKIVTADGNTWTYGALDTANLLGTVKSLDELCTISLDCSQNQGTIIHNEQLHCAYGVVSRGGWTVVNDTQNFIMGAPKGTWFSTTGRAISAVDVYFFGHGNNYRQALYDYTRISGNIPMNSRPLYGAWFTRWYDYDHDDVARIVEEFERNQLPLDVLVLDMNWHTKNDWTGFSWDTQLFPFPEDTLALLRQRGLMVAANLHDADGLGPWEDTYQKVCQIMGQDPSAQQSVVFQPLNATYMHAIEDVTLVNAGFDFYWIDWQQGGDAGGCSGGRLNPTFITDHVRGTTHARRGENLRDNILARWGGLGNHRYQVGFSGDVNFLSWECMAFQPYFSATAANVAYGSISHDLVGPPHDHELHVRWMQFGAFSGVMRIHDRGMSAGSCWGSQDCAIVNIWRLPEPFRDAIHKVMNQRVALLPYIYAGAKRAYDTGVPFLHPMYYDFPTHDSAYSMGPNGQHAQYMFGDDMIVAPIAFAADATTGLASKAVWIPPGVWFDDVFGVVVNGEQWYSKGYALADTPVFVRAGAVIPKLPKPHKIGVAGQSAFAEVDFHVYAGASEGQATLYEDDGRTYDYVKQKFAKTVVTYNMSSDQSTVTVDIAAMSGSYTGVVSTRAIRVALVGFVPIASATVNGNPLAYGRFGGAGTFSYDGAAGTAWIDLGTVHVANDHSISVSFIARAQSSKASELKGIASKAAHAKRILDNVRETPWSNSVGPGFTKKLASTAAALTYLGDPSQADAWLAVAEHYPTRLTNAIAELNGSPAPPPPPTVFTSLVQLWNPARTDMCLCGSQACLSTNGDYEVMWTEGYQPLSGGVPFNDYWSQTYEDNWGDTASSAPSGYAPAIFANGQVLSSAQSGAVCLQVWWNSQTQDHMTLASQQGLNWAVAHGYQKVESCIGYVLTTAPPEFDSGATTGLRNATLGDAAFSEALALLQSL